MKENFTQALKHVLTFEGGYVDHPLDPGGATNFGITRRTLERFLGRRVSKAEVKALTLEDAREIYEQLYWAPLLCDAMPAGVDLAVFDCGVNQGIGRAKVLLQKAVGVPADGVIGPQTLAALAAADPRDLLNEFMARRMRAYGRLSRLFSVFGLGWSRRLMATHKAALELIKEPAS